MYYGFYYPYTSSMKNRLICDICGVQFYSNMELPSCVICNKVLCDNHNNHDFCPQHWDDLKDSDKKKVIKLDKVSRTFSVVLKIIGILSVLIIIAGFALLTQDFEGRAIFVLLNVILGGILLIGTIFFYAEALSKKKSVKRMTIDYKYKIRKKEELVSDSQENRQTRKKELETNIKPLKSQ